MVGVVFGFQFVAAAVTVALTCGLNVPCVHDMSQHKKKNVISLFLLIGTRYDMDIAPFILLLLIYIYKVPLREVDTCLPGATQVE